jgi:hypothetical protein
MKKRNWVVGVCALAILAFAAVAWSDAWFTEVRNMTYKGLAKFMSPVTMEGTLTLNGATTVNNDITLAEDKTGGDQGYQNALGGKLRLAITALGAGTNGAASGKTVVLMDDSPAGEFAATDADVTCTTSTTHFKAGSASLKMAVTTVADTGDGCHDTGLSYDWTDDENVGGWVYTDMDLAAGDVVMRFTDNGGAHTIDLPVLSANKWHFVTLDISGTANGNKDSISAFGFQLAAAGATKAAAHAFNMWFDAWYKWDNTEEDALGNSLSLDSDYGILVEPTSGGAMTVLTRYTDYFIKYTSSNESVVWITDQSANNAVAFYSYTGGY